MSRRVILTLFIPSRSEETYQQHHCIRAVMPVIF